jgi:hypothetical protein
MSLVGSHPGSMRPGSGCIWNPLRIWHPGWTILTEWLKYVVSLPYRKPSSAYPEGLTALHLGLSLSLVICDVGTVLVMNVK